MSLIGRLLRRYTDVPLPLPSNDLSLPPPSNTRPASQPAHLRHQKVKDIMYAAYALGESLPLPSYDLSGPSVEFVPFASVTAPDAPPRGHRAADMAALADRWPINWTPEYREPTCASCGRKIRRMWHVWFEAGGYAKEIHLCRRCGRKYDLR